MAIAIGLFSLWDMYLIGWGVRPLDVAGFVILAGWATCGGLRGGWRLLWVNNSHNVAMATLIGLAILLAAVGAVNAADNVKPGIGFVLGAGVFAFSYTLAIKADSLQFLHKSLRFLLIVHLFCLVSQWIYFQVSGEVLNFLGFLGHTPRLLVNWYGNDGSVLIQHMRPAGLFLEPAAYCFTMLMLVLVRYRISRKLDVVDYGSIASMLLTRSFWGIVSVGILFAVVHRRDRWFQIAAAACAAVAVLVIGFADLLNEPLREFYVWRRLTNFHTDLSVSIRYSGLVALLTDPSFLVSAMLGNGVSNDYHQFGASGIGFLLSAAGVLGTVVMMGLLANFAPQGERLWIMLVIILCMSAAPKWTYFFWWLWLALMLRPWPEAKARGADQSLRPVATNAIP